MEFNNQHAADEVVTKLLLMLPMVPKREHEKIALNFLRLVPAENQREVQAIQMLTGGVHTRKAKVIGSRAPVPGSGEDGDEGHGFVNVGMHSEI